MPKTGKMSLFHEAHLMVFIAWLSIVASIMRHPQTVARFLSNIDNTEPGIYPIMASKFEINSSSCCLSDIDPLINQVQVQNSNNDAGFAVSKQRAILLFDTGNMEFLEEEIRSYEKLMDLFDILIFHEDMNRKHMHLLANLFKPSIRFVQISFNERLNLRGFGTRGKQNAFFSAFGFQLPIFEQYAVFMRLKGNYVCEQHIRAVLYQMESQNTDYVFDILDCKSSRNNQTMIQHLSTFLIPGRCRNFTGFYTDVRSTESKLIQSTFQNIHIRKNSPCLPLLSKSKTILEIIHNA